MNLEEAGRMVTHPPRHGHVNDEQLVGESALDVRGKGCVPHHHAVRFEKRQRRQYIRLIGFRMI